MKSHATLLQFPPTRGYLWCMGKEQATRRVDFGVQDLSVDEGIDYGLPGPISVLRQGGRVQVTLGLLPS